MLLATIYAFSLYLNHKKGKIQHQLYQQQQRARPDETHPRPDGESDQGAREGNIRHAHRLGAQVQTTLDFLNPTTTTTTHLNVFLNVLNDAKSLSRYKLKFSPDKVDTMIVQAIALLDDLDKELNNYIMRCKEWYGWHFPELAKLIQDNIAYCKTIKKIGYKTNAMTTELNDILPEDVEQKIKEAAEVSMGTEISEEDLSNIMNLCDQVTQKFNKKNK